MSGSVSTEKKLETMLRPVVEDISLKSALRVSTDPLKEKKISLNLTVR